MRAVASAPAPYHHGDLRHALLDAAGAILAETGRWDSSLCEVARRAGVSHAAPYRHFAGREVLMAAVAVEGCGALHAHLAAATAARSGAAAALRTLGQNYIGFDVAHPALYRLMFSQALPSVEGLPPPVLAVVTAWSLVHGFTLLTIDKVVDREVRPATIEVLAAQVAARLITGLMPR